MRLFCWWRYFIPILVPAFLKLFQIEICIIYTGRVAIILLFD